MKPLPKQAERKIQSALRACRKAQSKADEAKFFVRDNCQQDPGLNRDVHNFAHILSVAADIGVAALFNSNGRRP